MTENAEQPKLHGWITVEYGHEIMAELADFLEKHSPYFHMSETDDRFPEYIDCYFARKIK